MSELTTNTVSAVIPCFNGGEWLRDAIASIQAQSLPVLEIIVVDDCSTDGSGDIARDCGVSVVRNAINSGEGYSRNHGIRTASGTLIASLDSDDLWMPHHVETLVNLFENYPFASAAFAAVQRFGLRNELIQGCIPLGEPSDVFWLAFNTWVHIPTGSMVRKEAFLQVGGFNEKERYAVDYDMWLRLSRDRLFVCTHEVTSLWRWHDKNQSASRGRQIEAVYRFREAYIEQQRAQGDIEFLKEAQRHFPQIWRRDVGDAWRSRDIRLLRFLSLYAYRNIQGIPRSEMLYWATRSLIPEAALLARDRWRGRAAPKIG